MIKAPIRIELMHKGFADLSLTAWVRRRNNATITIKLFFVHYIKVVPKPVFWNNLMRLLIRCQFCLVGVHQFCLSCL